MSFESTRPGSWLRDDVADILTALVYAQHALPAEIDLSTEFARGRVSGLFEIATALGLRWRDRVQGDPGGLQLAQLRPAAQHGIPVHWPTG